eukprot:1726724-Rhodomonas_salina.1
MEIAAKDTSAPALDKKGREILGTVQDDGVQLPDREVATDKYIEAGSDLLEVESVLTGPFLDELQQHCYLCAMNGEEENGELFFNVPWVLCEDHIHQQTVAAFLKCTIEEISSMPTMEEKLTKVQLHTAGDTTVVARGRVRQDNNIDGVYFRSCALGPISDLYIKIGCHDKSKSGVCSVLLARNDVLAPRAAVKTVLGQHFLVTSLTVWCAKSLLDCEGTVIRGHLLFFLSDVLECPYAATGDKYEMYLTWRRNTEASVVAESHISSINAAEVECVVAVIPQAFWDNKLADLHCKYIQLLGS